MYRVLLWATPRRCTVHLLQVEASSGAAAIYALMQMFGLAYVHMACAFPYDHTEGVTQLAQVSLP
jgi:hypothetical protein